MEPSTETNEELRARVRQQEVVAELGQRALELGDLDRLLREASTAVAETLDADLCAVFEVLPHRDDALLRQGVGWRDGVVGAETLTADADSWVGRTLDRERPVIADDLRADERFAAPELLVRHDAVGGITALVGSVNEPWGVLGAFATERREFDEHDANFVRSVANVLASAVENERTQTELEEVYGRISDAFFALDREWRFTYLNERAHELINPDERALVGRTIWDEFPEALGRKFKSEYERAMYEQETVSFEEYYPEPLDAWFEVRAYPSETGLSVYFRDVTGRTERDRELERTERRFQAIFEDPNILVGLLDPDGTVLDINRTAMEYIDADLDEVTGEPFWETPWWGAGDDVRADVRRWTERAAAGEYVDFEADLTRPDGERYTLDGVFRPVTNDEGDVVSVIVSDRDVTERKERERQLEESERRYRTLVEHFPNGAVALVDEDLRYQTVGGNPRDTADATVEEIEGSPVGEALPPELADELAPRYEAALDGESSAFTVTTGGRVYDFQVVPVRDDDGAVFAALGMSQDVTERREYERQLEESEQRYRTLAESFPNGLVTLFDEDLRQTLVAGQGFDRLAVSRDDVEDCTPREAWGDDVADDLEPALRASLDGEERSVELSYAGREWVVHAVPITDENGDVFAGMSMTQDITERKENRRKLEASNERLESFASMLAHELRNPVTIGQIYGQQLADEVAAESDAGSNAEAVEYVTEAFDRIEDMIDVLLVLSRGRDAVGERTPVDLADVAREAWDDVDAPDATLSVEIDRTIQADETYVRHLFRNLFENSVEHGSTSNRPEADDAVEHGGDGVTVTVGDLPDGFYVADDGDGIPEDDRETVFEAGYTTATGQGGTGLGLAYVDELAEVYEWDLTVTESDAGGARFEFRNVDRD